MMKPIEPWIERIPYFSPHQLLAVCAQPGTLLLESVRGPRHLSRYSFLAVDPFQSIVFDEEKLIVNQKPEATPPFAYLKKCLAQYRLNPIPNRPPFQGGIAGLFSYDLGRFIEDIPETRSSDNPTPDLSVGLYDLVFGFDHWIKQAWIFSSGYPKEDHSQREQRAQARIEQAQQWVKEALKQTPSLKPLPQCQPLKSNFQQADYLDAVEKARKSIFSGEVFEVNIAQRWSTQFKQAVNPIDLYAHLRQANPAPFSACFLMESAAILSTSPERFLQSQQGWIATHPIKGTIKREADQNQDAQKALLACEKNRAENMMIVDLLRNDLSRVCKPFSVRASEVCALETYETVHHLVSKVIGELDSPYDLIDLIRACFPGGSITGAPKVEAMKLIKKIEPHRRGAYCGSLGYIGFNQNMDTNICIRTMVLDKDKVIFNAGGAIVADSDPQEEYEETLTKTRSLQTLLEGFACDMS